ncbi:MAG: PilZ domain-containing protein [bacterium]
MAKFRFSERRHFIRAQVTMDVLCARQDQVKWLDVFIARSKNICKRGIFVETEELVPPAREVYIQFNLANIAYHFRVNSKVIWNSADDIIRGIGLLFTDIGPKYEQMIEHYVLRHYDFRSPSKF